MQVACKDENSVRYDFVAIWSVRGFFGLFILICVTYLHAATDLNDISLYLT